MRRPFFRPDFWTPIMSAPPGFHFCLSILDPMTAAVYSDALHIEEGVVGLKQRAHELALAGASAA